MATAYSDFYDALEETSSDKPRLNLKQVLRRRYREATALALVVLVIGLAATFGLPAQFRSQAIILIEQQDIPQELIRSTVTGFADQRVEMIRQRVMTSANLTRIIDRFDLYAEDRQRQPREVILEQMRDAINQDMISADVVDPRSGRPTQATIAFSLSFDHQSATTAQAVANELVSLFLQENIKNRSESASETSSFLTAEANKLDSTITTLEKQMARFKEINADSLPELLQLNLQMLDRHDNQLQEINRQLSSLEEQKIHLQSQLALTRPYDQMVAENGQRIMGPADRLKILQTELISLRASYAEEHPRIIRVSREIDALKAETGGSDPGADLQAKLAALQAELATASQNYGEEHPEIRKLNRLIAGLEEGLESSHPAAQVAAGTPDNPLYIDLQARLKTVTSNEQSYLDRRGELEEKIQLLETAIQRTPEVEQGYKKLARDYDNAMLKYREIKNKQMEAQLAESLESGRKGERFTLIEPPLLPEEPVSPNRPVLLVLSLLLGAGAFAGTIALRESTDPSIHHPEELEQITGELPLAAIPTITTITERSRQQQRKRQALIATVTMLTVALVAFHLLIMPLDVAWFVAMRRLGI